MKSLLTNAVFFLSMSIMSFLFTSEMPYLWIVCLSASILFYFAHCFMNGMKEAYNDACELVIKEAQQAQQDKKFKSDLQQAQQSTVRKHCLKPDIAQAVSDHNGIWPTSFKSRLYFDPTIKQYCFDAAYLFVCTKEQFESEKLQQPSHILPDVTKAVGDHNGIWPYTGCENLYFDLNRSTYSFDPDYFFVCTVKQFLQETRKQVKPTESK